MNKARRKAINAIDTNEIRKAAEKLRDLVEAAFGEFEQAKGEEEEAKENMPESLQEGEKGEAMQAIIDGLDEVCTALDDCRENCGSIIDALDEFENNVDLG